MELSDYQMKALRTLNTTNDFKMNRVNICMGLAGETGETIDYLKKVIFHGHELDKEKLKSELGDILWYVSNLAYLYSIDLEDVAQANVEKLNKRYPQGFSSKDSVERKE